MLLYARRATVVALRFGRRRPVPERQLSPSDALAALTSYRSAACKQDSLPSDAAMTWPRRSRDKARRIPAGLPR